MTEDYISRNITLSFLVDGMNTSGLPDSDLEEAFNRVLADWDEGRYSFFREMFNHAITEMLRETIGKVVDAQTKEKYTEEEGKYMAEQNWYKHAQIVKREIGSLYLLDNISCTVKREDKKQTKV